MLLSSALLVLACAKDHRNPAAGPPAAGIGSAADGGGRGGSAVLPGADESSRIGARAIAKLAPLIENAAPQGSFAGEAVFTQTARGVDLALEARGCEVGSSYPVFIQDGPDCAEATTLGPRWDGQRGEGIPAVNCTGTTGGGRTAYTRPADADKAWTVGAPARSNLVGHAIVVYEPKALRPIACGTIERASDVEIHPEPPAAGTGGDLRPEVRAQVAGYCVTQLIVRDNLHECPNPLELEECARAHCEYDTCLAICRDYLACIDRGTDACNDAFTCPIDEACRTCQSTITQCVFGFCTQVIACAAPVMPDGPCAKLEACCAMQGDNAPACLETVRSLAGLSGDQSCAGAMKDWDTLAHLKVPCTFE